MREEVRQAREYFDRKLNLKPVMSECKSKSFMPEHKSKPAMSEQTSEPKLATPVLKTYLGPDSESDPEPI